MARIHTVTPLLSWFFVLALPGWSWASTDLRIICRPCEDASDCGDHTDLCLNYRDGSGRVVRSACGMHCGDQDDCAGLECRTIPDQPGLNQCYDVEDLCADYPLFECSAAGHCLRGQDCVDGRCVDLGLGLGEACEGDEDCASGLCLNPGSGQVCTQDCDWLDPLGDDCPEGFFCTERDGCGDGICAPGDPGAGDLGDGCDQDMDCASAFCSRPPSRTGELCSEPCVVGGTACADGMHCEDRDVGCGSCVADCADASDCPDGLGCVHGRCRTLQPDGGLCATDEECQSGECEDGTCQASWSEDDGGADGGTDSGPGGSTLGTECTCSAAGRDLTVRGFPLPLLLVLLPALGLLRRGRPRHEPVLPGRKRGDP